MKHGITCPQCGAPLQPHRFAKSIVCSHCGTTVQLDESAVSARKFHQSYQIWNSPDSYPVSSLVSIGDRHWDVQKLIAHGEFSDVYRAKRARWPTELVVLKILREVHNENLFENEWAVLESLHQSDAPGAETFKILLPQNIMRGTITAGSYTGKRASIFRWAGGFRHTFDDVHRAFPGGIPPQASIWIWRRILETLSFVHGSGFIHGAVLPPHLLIQDNEHGVRIVGYAHAGQKDEKLRPISSGFESFYPESTQGTLTLTTQLDLLMSARCITTLLGGDPLTASLPGSLPPQLATIIQRIALSNPRQTPKQDAWSIREELGTIAKEVFGPPQFIPIVMPSEIT